MDRHVPYGNPARMSFGDGHDAVSLIRVLLALGRAVSFEVLSLHEDVLVVSTCKKSRVQVDFCSGMGRANVRTKIIRPHRTRAFRAQGTVDRVIGAWRLGGEVGRSLEGEFAKVWAYR